MGREEKEGGRMTQLRQRHFHFQQTTRTITERTLKADNRQQIEDGGITTGQWQAMELVRLLVMWCSVACFTESDDWESGG